MTQLIIDVPDAMLFEVARYAEENDTSFESALLMLAATTLDNRSKISIPMPTPTPKPNVHNNGRRAVVGAKTYSTKSQIKLSRCHFDTGFEEAITRYRSRSTFTIGDLYNFAARVLHGNKFTMNALIEALPADLRKRITEDQIRGWPVSFHRKMTKDDYRFQKEDGPIIYWYP